MTDEEKLLTILDGVDEYYDIVVHEANTEFMDSKRYHYAQARLRECRQDFDNLMKRIELSSLLVSPVLEVRQAAEQEYERRKQKEERKYENKDRASDP